MPASHMLSFDSRRRALISSSYSPKLPDASQFPLSAILAKLPLLPDDPILDAPGQLAFPTPPIPPTPPTPGIDTGLPQPQVAGDLLLPAFKTVPLPPDDDDEFFKADKKKRFLDSRSVAWWTRFDSDSDNSLKLKTSSDKKKNPKRFLGSRSVAWWTRF